MLDAATSDLPISEPLVRLSDLDEYRAGLARHLSGEWDGERFTAHRVRFGVYGQKQPGVQMVRIKIPGGRLPVGWLRTLAAVNRNFAEGAAHVTTRQDVQIYSVALEKTPDLLEALYSNGITTREACGNTIRNLTACALAGACPRELVDAGLVADQLSRAWLRHPLVQHMPRKIKITVSGCATDCGHTAIHDLGFIAITKDGRPGFRATAGGGLGSQPRAAVEIADFVTEDELPAVLEALARLHQRYSDRRNRNAARLKFVAKRFGDDKFRALFAEEFERVRGLPQRHWAGLDWNRPAEAAISRAPVGLIDAHDGSVAVSVSVPLGIVSSEQWEGLADIADRVGVTELRATRDQNLLFLGVAREQSQLVVDGVRAIGFDVPRSAADIATVISCPGTTTCRIGITNSQGFAREALNAALSDPQAKGTSVHVSGCQNSCGLHHVADFGLHGMAKKIDGQPAPYYQLHFGGDAASSTIGLTGPMIAARHAVAGLGLLRQAWASGRQDGEGVRAWAERQGKDGIDAILNSLGEGGADDLFVDWGDSHDFAGAPQAKGECAAPFAAADLYEDLADDSLITLDRALAVGNQAIAAEAADTGIEYAARRLLHLKGVPSEDGQNLAAHIAAIGAHWADQADVAGAARTALAARGGEAEALREAVALLIDTARDLAENPVSVAAAVGDINALLGAAE
ncbi:MAG: nitrite/sulfite reductase [Alphaproteobacteria bacterium]|nr:nitrite/sulfite reductase [Alphaproteobacteria bacterium]